MVPLQARSMTHDPTPRPALVRLCVTALRVRVAREFPRHAAALGLRPDALEIAYVPNWGGFVNASFRVSDGVTAVRIKLAGDSEHVERLSMWRSRERLLRERYRAPRMLGWNTVAGTPHE